MQFDTKGLGEYVTNDTLESETGIWLDFNGRKLRVLRAGGSNRRYNRVLQQNLRPFIKRARGNADFSKVDPAKLRDIFIDVYAETIVVDWKGVQTPAGENVPFSLENVTAFLTAFPEIFDDLQVLCGERATFQEDFLDEVKEDLGKN